MKNAALFLLSGLLLCSTTLPGVAQDQSRQDQKKKADQNWVVELKSVLVELRAVVTDRQGHIVEGLKKEDFEIREKGHVQDLSFFAEQHIGPASITQRVVPANVTIPGEQPSPPEFVPARSVLLFVDTLNLTGPNLARVKQSLKKFIAEKLTDQDSVAIVTSGGIEGIPVLFTRDRNLLSYFINRIAVWGSADRSYFSPLLAAGVRREVDEAIDVAIAIIISEMGLSMDPPLPRQVLKQMVSAKSEEVLALASYKRTSLLKSMSAASEIMSRAPGQRVMFLISEGFSLIDSRGNTDSGDLQQSISRAVRSGVLVYSIDAKGLEPPADIDASRRGLTLNAIDGTTTLSPSLAGRAMSYISASEKEARDGMTVIANDTGGAAFTRTNDINLALQRSFEANRIYYSLGYYPSSEGSGFREVAVGVKGHPEYTVRTQKGYLAADPEAKAKLTPKSPQQRLFQAMSQSIPETALGLSARASYLEVETDKAQVSIQIEVDGKDLSYQEGTERAKIALDLAGAIYDRRGRLVTSFIEKINGGVALGELEKVKRLGFSYNKRIELKPGFYQVRVGVLEPKTDRRGTAASWVEVPDLSKGKLAMSSILLGAETDAEKSIADSSKWSAIRSYKKGSHLAYCVLIYNAASTVGSDLTIQSEIYQSEQLVYESEPQPVSSRVMSKDNKGIEAAGQLNLDLEPGFYELRVAIKDKSNHEFRRTVDFLVAP